MDVYFRFFQKKYLNFFFESWEGGSGRGDFEKNLKKVKKNENFNFCSDFRENIISRHNFGCLIDFRGSKNDSEHSNSLKSDLVDPNTGIEIIFISLPKRCKWLTVM